jgi:hypothetical protein
MTSTIPPVELWYLANISIFRTENVASKQETKPGLPKNKNSGNKRNIVLSSVKGYKLYSKVYHFL